MGKVPGSVSTVPLSRGSTGGARTREFGNQKSVNTGEVF